MFLQQASYTPSFGGLGIKGSVETQKFSASGSCSVEGDLEARDFNASGSFKVKGMSRHNRLKPLDRTE